MQIVKNGSKGDLVKLVQLMLNENGYNCGTADGIFGTNNEKAVEKEQKHRMEIKFYSAMTEQMSH